jgi:Fe-S-cluster-containing dehydrogenase component
VFFSDLLSCSLCVDRIYNDNLEPEDQMPACVRACPTGARHFGDLGDPASDVSRLVDERGGYDLLEEFGYKPVNKYLPPRDHRDENTSPALALRENVAAPDGSLAERFFAWADQKLSR